MAYRVTSAPVLTGRQATIFGGFQRTSTCFYPGGVSVVDHRDCVSELPSTEWFPPMGSRLADLQLSGSSIISYATQHHLSTACAPPVEQL